MRLCSIDGCDKRHYGNGYCATHNARFKKHGSPHAKTRARPGEAKRYLFDVVSRYASEACLFWPYARFSDGCAAVHIDGTGPKRVPRIICQEVHGAPEGSVDAAHSCGNGHLGCVNPHHLRWASRKENVADAREHGTICRGSRNGTSKLTEEDVRAIRNSRASNKALTTIYGVSPATISVVRSGLTWRHVEP